MAHYPEDSAIGGIILSRAARLDCEGWFLVKMRNSIAQSADPWSHFLINRLRDFLNNLRGSLRGFIGFGGGFVFEDDSFEF